MIARTPPRGAHIAGTVVDAGTGRPLAGAFLGISRYPTAYADGATPSDDVTLADGSFQVHEIPFLEDLSGRPVQVLPLAVVRAGYRPRLWTYQAASGEDIGTITGVEIALEPAGGEPVGGLRGRILRDGAPVAYLTVGLGPADRADKGAVGLPGRTAATDRDGVFVFTDLPAGAYVVHPGFRRGDAAWYPDQPANVPRTVTAGEVTDAGDYQVLWELEAQSPRDGDVVTRDLREFRWTSYSWAGLAPGGWVFTLDRGAPRYTAVPGWRLAPGDTLLPGHHVWTVEALGPDDAPIGTFGGFAEFLVVE